MRHRAFPSLGFGVGLRRDHYRSVLDTRPPIDWFEIITENFMVAGGRPLAVLEQVRANYPIVMPGVSLSIGSADPLNRNYLTALREMACRFEPARISHHLCWTGVGGHKLHALLPLPYTDELVRSLAARIRQVQDFLGRPLLIENISSYLTFRVSDVDEWEFLRVVAEQADCGILLDINNVYVNAFNHRFDPQRSIDAVPPRARDPVSPCRPQRSRNPPARYAPPPSMPGGLAALRIRRAAHRSARNLNRMGRQQTCIRGAGRCCRRSAAACGRRFRCGKPTMNLSLKELQGVLKRLITAPGGVDAALTREARLHPGAIDGLIRGGPALGARERLEIYANAYFHRLFDCLMEDYPATLAVIGEGAFRTLVSAYLSEHPSDSTSVFGVGRLLPEFIIRHHVTSDRPFLGELARLERTLIEVFHAADAPALEARDLQRVPAEAWPELRLSLHPAVTILDCAWAVDDLLEPASRERNGAPLERRPTTILVWRQNDAVYRRRVDGPERTALVLVRRGATFGAVCEAVAPLLGASAAHEIKSMLSRWLRDGLLRSGDTGPRVFRRA
jgi:uncharacterized protein (UPF0276 family)